MPSPRERLGRTPAGRTGQRGFSLLEIIVVVVLIAISVSYVLVRLERDPDAVAELEAKRFASLVAQARDESILSGRPYAVEVDSKLRAYTFLQHGEEWAPVTDDEVFRARRVPSDLDIALNVLDGPESSGLLLIEGLGEISPFELKIGGDERVYTVSIDESQNLSVTHEAK